MNRNDSYPFYILKRKSRVENDWNTYLYVRIQCNMVFNLDGGKLLFCKITKDYYNIN